MVAELTADAGTDEQKMEKIYYFVRDEIQFGWVYLQDIPAEEVLQKRRGVGMQKANLLVAMAMKNGGIWQEGAELSLKLSIGR